MANKYLVSQHNIALGFGEHKEICPGKNYTQDEIAKLVRLASYSNDTFCKDLGQCCDSMEDALALVKDKCTVKARLFNWTLPNFVDVDFAIIDEYADGRVININSYYIAPDFVPTIKEVE